MPGPLLHVLAQIKCIHAGQGFIFSSNTRVLVSGMPVATVIDQTVIAGCTFAPLAPHPCVTVRYLAPAAKVLVNLQPALVQTNPAVTVAPDQVAQGPAIIAGQPRVTAL